MKKYIIIPGFGPLYALRKIFGPQNGPVRKPIRVETETIKELLIQKPPVKVLEVRLTDAKRGIYDETVELNLKNYDAVNFSRIDKSQVEKTMETVATISDTLDIVRSKVENIAAAVTEPKEDPATVVNVIHTNPPIVEEEKVSIEPTPAIDVTMPPVQKLTKAQRRAAAKQKREAEQALDAVLEEAAAAEETKETE